jgi:hypothetical protein
MHKIHKIQTSARPHSQHQVFEYSMPAHYSQEHKDFSEKIDCSAGPLGLRQAEPAA